MRLGHEHLRLAYRVSGGVAYVLVHDADVRFKAGTVNIKQTRHAWRTIQTAAAGMSVGEPQVLS